MLKGNKGKKRKTETASGLKLWWFFKMVKMLKGKEEENNLQLLLIHLVFFEEWKTSKLLNSITNVSCKLLLVNII